MSLIIKEDRRSKNILFKIKKMIHKDKYKEYITVQRKLRRTQHLSTQIFIEVKEDPNRHTGTDPELTKINNEANELCFKFVELDRFFYGKKSQFGSARD